MVSPISAVRIAGIRPAAADPGGDPYEDGAGIDVVTEPLVATQYDNRVSGIDGGADASLDAGRQNLSEQVASAYRVASVAATAPTSPLMHAQGTRAIATSYDPRPANHADTPGAVFSSPLMRAMSTYALR